MKVRIAVAVATALCAAFLACGVAACSPDDGFEYTLSEDGKEYTLIYYDGDESDVSVPEKHRGKPVTAVGPGAFAYCGAATVTLPDGIKEIGAGAFEGCASLESVVLPDGITEIPEEAFSGCASLEEVPLPGSVTEIGDSAFCGCSSLRGITFGEGLGRIGERAFCGCSSLTSVSIPASVDDIGAYAFCACTSVTRFSVGVGSDDYAAPDGNLYTADGTELVQYALGRTEPRFEIPLGVTSIGDGAFACCGNIVSVSLSDTNAGDAGDTDGAPAEPGDEETEGTGDRPIYIGDYAFCGCDALETADIFEDVTRIGGHAFSGCLSLHVADISGNVERFGEYAFYGCVSLTDVRFGGGVTQIGAHAFEGCRNLESLTIPESVTKIGEYAFDWCESLARVTFESTNGWHVTTPGVTTGGTEINSLSDPSVNARYLTGTYCGYEWYTA